MRIILSILLLSVCYPVTSNCLLNITPENIDSFATLYPLDETNTSIQNWCNEVLIQYAGDCPDSVEVGFGKERLTHILIYFL